MRIFSILLLAGFIGFWVSATAQASSALDGLQGKKRVVLLFAKSRSFAGLDKQIDLLRARRPDLSERDTIVVVVEGRQEAIAAIGYTSLPRGAALQLTKRFNPESSLLTGVLIGKDGTEKSRWQRVIDPQEIIDLIDSMPMRQREAEEVTN